jgi:hypothetical protein
MLEMLLGSEAVAEIRRVPEHFHASLGESPLTGAGCPVSGPVQGPQTTTLYRFDSILKGFMTCYREKLETKIRVPDNLPQCT